MWGMLREKRAAMDPADVVALSVLLDRWCRMQCIDHSHPRAHDTAQNLIALRQAGATIDHLKQLLASSEAG
ncbi:hypothetical protein EV132_1543 [Rhizobium sullae]|uniref:Uncharacterized protein n=1 Tax=Rhizobium sullae TaxID=50338 RepID=A0A4V2V7R9_RHISU|nr:hypothetical protein EV132_1543 [Rhizobium sullae]